MRHYRNKMPESSRRIWRGCSRRKNQTYDDNRPDCECRCIRAIAASINCRSRAVASNLPPGLPELHSSVLQFADAGPTIRDELAYSRVGLPVGADPSRQIATADCQHAAALVE